MYLGFVHSCVEYASQVWEAPHTALSDKGQSNASFIKCFSLSSSLLTDGYLPLILSKCCFSSHLSIFYDTLMPHASISPTTPLHMPSNIPNIYPKVQSFIYFAGKLWNYVSLYVFLPAYDFTHGLIKKPFCLKLTLFSGYSFRSYFSRFFMYAFYWFCRWVVSFTVEKVKNPT